MTKTHNLAPKYGSRRRVAGAVVGLALAGAAVKASGPINRGIDRLNGLDGAIAASDQNKAPNKGLERVKLNPNITDKSLEPTIDPDVFYASYNLKFGQSLSFPAAKYAYGEDPLAAANKIMEYIPGMTESDRHNYNVQPGVISFAVDTEAHKVVPFEEAPQPLNSAESR